MANSVRISSEYNDKIEEMVEVYDNEYGFRPDKKELVEKAIDEMYNKDE